jgi:hypothetical protein
MLFKLPFFRRRRIRTIVDQSLPTLTSRLEALSGSERAAVLAIANAMIASLEKETGVAIARAPAAMPADHAIRLVAGLAESHAGIVKRTDSFGASVSPEVVSQMLREAFAIEMVIVTVSLAVHPECLRDVRIAWKTLYDARGNAEGAWRILLAFGRATGGVSPLPWPVPRKWTKADVVSLAGRVPPFLMKKKGAAVRRPVKRGGPAKRAA